MEKPHESRKEGCDASQPSELRKEQLHGLELISISAVDTQVDDKAFREQLEKFRHDNPEFMHEWTIEIDRVSSSEVEE